MYNLSFDEISMVDGGGESGSGGLGAALRYLSSGGNAAVNGQAKLNNEAYNRARAARNGYPTGSTTDMNSPGDQSMNDNAGGGR